jgi:DUF1680 family protein
MNFTINDSFWNRTINLVCDEVIPYQWAALNDEVEGAAPSHCIRNFEIAAGRAEGEFYGYVFQDSDLYKWLEAAAFSLAQKPDKELEALADKAVELICAVQQPDGYINTHFTIKMPNSRWRNMREAHELYCAGHMFEAAAAYYNSTGKRAILDSACRFADLIDRTFGLEDGKTPSYPGHEEVELALVKLGEATGNGKYLELARYFIDQRGREPFIYDEEMKHPDFFSRSRHDLGREYRQTHKPPAEQDKAVGHAVRAMYLYTAMADLAVMGDEKLGEACDKLYHNVRDMQMHLTGAVGSSAKGEAFTCDYDLPPDTVYGETCASIGRMMFCERMYRLRGDAEYIDTCERALYNSVLSGISLSGKEFFYVNPLETHPGYYYQNPELEHVDLPRRPWFGCACCPPNLARTVLSLGNYAFDADEDQVTVKLYVSGEIRHGGKSVKIETRYPYGGEVRLTPSGGRFKLLLRCPAHAPITGAKVNGVAIPVSVDKGWLIIEREWNGESVELSLDTAPKLIFANPAARHLRGRCAVQAGPLVYCAEGKGVGLHKFTADSKFAPCAVPNGLPDGAIAFKADVLKQVYDEGALYTSSPPAYEQAELVLIPYFMWGNLGELEMTVFFQYS